jgi:hypothetical protein
MKHAISAELNSASESHESHCEQPTSIVVTRNKMERERARESEREQEREETREKEIA